MKKSSLACAVCPALSVTISVTTFVPCFVSTCATFGPLLSGAPSLQVQR